MSTISRIRLGLLQRFDNLDAHRTLCESIILERQKATIKLFIPYGCCAPVHVLLELLFVTSDRWHCIVH